MSVYSVVQGLAQAGYQRHALHGDGVIWPEKNCYADLWIELLHALKLEPQAMLPFVLAVDFEGDQWTFFKPSHDELRTLYGIEVTELTVWLPLLQHAREHLRAGKWISVEADAHWLPDTAGTDYRQAHSKTTIVLNEIDEANERLGYFHNAGYFELSGEDFRRTFRIGQEDDATYLPLFAELVRLDRVAHRPTDALRAQTRTLLATHLARRPEHNPVARFSLRFAQDLPALQDAGLAHYHRWAFGTVRQMGAAYELAAQCLDWLAGNGSLHEPATAFRRVAELSKTLILKGARTVASKRAFDAAPLLDEAAAAWDAGMAGLQSALARG
ncbi:MAG: DUF1839 family protein [Burkholderiales bacterium]